MEDDDKSLTDNEFGARFIGDITGSVAGDITGRGTDDITGRDTGGITGGDITVADITPATEGTAAADDGDDLPTNTGWQPWSSDSTTSNASTSRDAVESILSIWASWAA